MAEKIITTPQQHGNVKSLPSKDTETDASKTDESDIYNQLKAFYYKNVLKFEQQHNNGLSASVNNLNDFEMKEILGNVENFVQLCVNSIKENDSVFNVNIKQNSTLYKKAGTIQPEDTTKKLLPTIDDCKNDIINIKSIIPYDLIHYGLKAGNIIENFVELSIHE